MLDLRFGGLKVYVEHHPPTHQEQWRFPRSKRRRIRRKWAANRYNWHTVVERLCVRMGGTFIMDPTTYAEFLRSCERG